MRPPANEPKRRVLALAIFLVLSLLAAAPATGGEVPDDPRIVGGEEVIPGTYPFLVALVSSAHANSWNGQFCGGSLIDPEWVMTAAHCVVNQGVTIAPSQIDVVAGRHDLNCVDWDAGTPCAEGERLDVAAIHVNPAYNTQPGFSDNDIALLRLTEAATEGSPVTELGAAANVAEWSPNDTATVMGWGNTKVNQHPAPYPTFPYVPHAVDMPVISDQQCSNAWNNNFNGGLMVCIGELPGGDTDSCNGDSGGPAVVPRPGGGWIQFGIVSWGFSGCAVEGYPGVYAEVAAFGQFISDTLGSGPPPPPPGDPTIVLASNSIVLQPANDRALGKVLVHDEDGDPLSGVTTTVQWTIDGVEKPEKVKTTNSAGRVNLAAANLDPGDSLEFCVLSLAKAGYDLDPGLSLPDCAQATWPGGPGGDPDEMTPTVSIVLQVNNDRAVGKVKVEDGNGDALAGVTATVQWTIDGVDKPQKTKDTNSAGRVNLAAANLDPGDDLEFCLLALVEPGYTLDPAIILPLCATSVWP